MELQVTTLDGKAAGDGHALRRHLRPRAARRHPAAHGALPAAQGDSRARTRRRTAPRSRAPQEDVQAEGHGRRPPRRARRRSSAAAARPSARSPRSHAIDLPKKVRALALKHALSAKAKAGELIIVDELSPPRSQDRSARRDRSASSAGQRADHRRRRARREFRAAPPATSRNIDVLPVQGINVYDILRRDKLVLTKAALEALEARFT